MDSADLCINNNSIEEDVTSYEDMMMTVDDNNNVDGSTLPSEQELEAMMALVPPGENDATFYDNFNEEDVDRLLQDMHLPVDDSGNMNFYEPELAEAHLMVDQENARDQLYKEQPEDGIFPSLRSQVAKISEIVEGVIAGGDYDRAYDILVKLEIVESESQRELRKFADSLNRFKCVIKMHNANRELFVNHMKLQHQEEEEGDDEDEPDFDNEAVKSIYDKISARIKAIDGEADDDNHPDDIDSTIFDNGTLEKTPPSPVKEGSVGDDAKQPPDSRANTLIDSNILLLPGPSAKSGKTLTDIIAPKSASMMDPPLRGRRNSARNKRGVNNNSQLISPAADASVLGATTTPADQKKGAADQKRSQTRRTSSRGSVLDGRVYSLASLTVETSMNLFTGAKYREPRLERIVAHAYYLKESNAYKLYLVDNNISPVDHKRVIELKASQVKSIRWDLPKDLRETHAAGYDVHRVPKTPITAYEVAMSRQDVINNVRDIRKTERQFLLTANPFATAAAPAARPQQNHPTRFHHHAKHADLVEMEVICPNGDLEDVMMLILTSPYARSIFTQKRVNITTENIKRFVKKVNTLVFYTTADCALDIRHFLEEREIKVKDSMYERQGLGIFYQKTDELVRRAEFFVNVGRREGLTDVQMVFGVNMPLRAYVIFYLCEHGSKTYTPAYVRANEKLLSYKGVELSEAQTEQLLDAFYWTHLAPPGQRINFGMIISFYDSVGRTVRLKSPHMVHGQSVGRTSASACVRNFKDESRMINVNNPSSHITIAPDGKTIVACSAVGKRKPNENPSVKDVLNIQRVTRARYERKKSLQKRESLAEEAPDASDAGGDQKNNVTTNTAVSSRTRKMRASSISAMPKEYDSIISCIPDTTTTTTTTTTTISPKETAASCDPNIFVKTEPAAEPAPPEIKVPKRRGRKPGSTNKPKATGSRTATKKRSRGRKSSQATPVSPGPQGAQKPPVSQAEMDDTLDSVAQLFQEVKAESSAPDSKADSARAPNDIRDVLEPTVAMETSIFDSSKLLTQPDKASILPQIANVAAMASMMQSAANATPSANTPCTFVMNDFTPLGTMTNVTQQPVERTLATNAGTLGLYPRGVMPVDDTHIQREHASLDPQEALLPMPIPPSTESIFPDGNVRPVAQLARAVFANPSRFSYDERKMTKKCEKRRKSAQQAVVALTPSETRSAASGRVRTLTGLVQYNAAEPQVSSVHQEVQPLALDVTAADLEMGDPLLQATFLQDNDIPEDMDTQSIPDV